MARLSYALTVIIAATFTVAMVSWFTELTPIAPPPVPDASWYAAAILASFLGIAGFAFLFNSSRRMVIAAAIVGTVANMVRLGILELGVTSYFAAFVGGTIIGLLGGRVARTMHLPRITTTVPAAVIMIPGAAMFRSVYHLNAGNMDQALSNLATASMVVLSIGCGLIFARLLTDKDWSLGRLIDFSRQPHDSRY